MHLLNGLLTKSKRLHVFQIYMAAKYPHRIDVWIKYIHTCAVYVFLSNILYKWRLSRELIACAWVKESTIAHRITNKMHASEKDGESVVSECVARACVCSCSLRHSMLLFTTALAIHINPYTTTESDEHANAHIRTHAERSNSHKWNHNHTSAMQT